MGHWSEPQIVIPHHDMPPGSLMTIRTREGTLTYRKEEDGGWEVVDFDGNARTKVSKSLDKPLPEGLG